MKKLIVIMVALCAMSFAAEAQRSQAIGVRVGAMPEFSYQRKADRHFIEWDLGYNESRGASFVVAYDFRIPILLEGLGVFAGVGPQILIPTKNAVTLGGALHTGLDWDIPRLPINVSIDWRPAFFIAGWDSRVNLVQYYSNGTKFYNEFGVGLRLLLRR